MLGGEDDDRGLIPRSVEFVFAKLAELAAKGWSYAVSAEMLEIYNEVSGGHDAGAAPPSRALLLLTCLYRARVCARSAGDPRPAGARRLVVLRRQRQA